MNIFPSKSPQNRFTNSIQKYYNTHKEPRTMKTYINPNCRKIRGSHNLSITCAYCKTFIAKYQKVGETNLVKMYNERIIEGSIDFSLYHGALFCPNCKERIATRYITKTDKKEAYRLVPSAFNKKKEN